MDDLVVPPCALGSTATLGRHREGDPISNEYRAGDIANGHVWTGSEWVPVNQDQSLQASQTSTTAGHSQPGKKRRVFLWVFLAVQALFLVWIIAGVGSILETSDCGGLSAADCEAVQANGAGLGVLIVIVLWMAVDVILGISYLVYRLAPRK